MPRAAFFHSKQVPLLAIMAKLGHQPVVQAAGGNYYFLSPFRPEKTPSFVVSEPKNVWSDFGEPPEPGQKVYGGDVLKLIMRLTELNEAMALQVLVSWAADLPEVVAMITEQQASVPLAKRGQSLSDGKTTFEDVRTEPLSWNVLTNYLASRGINWNLVLQSNRNQAHLQQIFYQVAGKPRQKPYFGVAWKTEGGWEVRSQNFQGTIGNKGVTWIPGKNSSSLVVFEGFIDYLSALTYWKQTSLDSTVLVLNSVNLLGTVLGKLREFDQVHWMGDNDAAGERALHVLRQAMPPGRVKAHNEVYRGFKDFNDWLTNTPPSKPLPPRRAPASERSKTAQYWLWVVFNERARGSRVADNVYRRCTFYCYSNDEEGLEQLYTLRNQLGDQLQYYRLCERTTGRQFRILEWAGEYHSTPQLSTPTQAA
ncbi:toprim domain-containing protein [Hymenobacter pini]|uniref:toprim domain-containing protein n=1 Tax=Hymenobacter pini TaxID=2880879 RepID=UPI001CF26ABB|nr:toprim domain-containing protein [Hymenobacter pini]MCA8830550.1 toprim domain-containing protein [Hymenobacter pini]